MQSPEDTGRLVWAVGQDMAEKIYGRTKAAQARD